MNNPKWLWIIIIILFVLGVTGLIFGLFGNSQILKDIGDFSLILTLAAVLAYVYFTYLIAKEAWTPSASFSLEQHPDDPYICFFHLQNHSKIPIKCWCNLNASVYGQTISLDGFYGGKSSFDLQPFGHGRGYFDILNILGQSKYSFEMVKKNKDFNNIKKQLYFNIDFWYSSINGKEIIHNPIQPHYFDFIKDTIVTDF